MDSLKTFESYFSVFKENNNKFIIRKTNKNFIRGNISFILNTKVSNKLQNYYEIKILNIPYDKKLKKLDYNSFISEQKLKYSYRTYLNLVFLTAKDLFYNDPELYRNIYNYIKNTEYSIFSMSLQKKIDDMLMIMNIEELDMYDNTNKFNL